jgi:hypothetical protein
MSILKFTGTAVLAVAGLAACSDSNGPAQGGRQLAFQLATQPTGAALRTSGAALVAGTETIGLGNDTIVLTRVQVVLRRIELERVGGTVCDSLISDDDCEELRTGPILLDLPLGTGAARSFSVAVDTGTYGEIKFKIHKPESSDDAAFVAANPDFDGVSIRATGTYNGTAFTYTSDLDVEQEHELVPPVSITDSTGVNLTLLVDLGAWFANQAGNGLIDPETANQGGGLEGEVKSNIETSFHAFEDDDRDGRDDHGGQ